MNARLHSPPLPEGTDAPTPASRRGSCLGPSPAPIEAEPGAAPAPPGTAGAGDLRACRESCGERRGGGDLRCPLRALLGCF